MANCLIALGSNLGDRAATIQQALTELATLPETRLLRHSHNYSFPPIGGPLGQPDFLNAAVLLESHLAPPALFEHLLQIEEKHDRRRAERWSARTLDIDMLLYEDQVIDSPKLVVPHPRMSYRRFVLQPAADVAALMVHPIIGLTIGNLLRRLDSAPDNLAIISPAHNQRHELVQLARMQFGARVIDPTASQTSAQQELWPQELTTWLSLSTFSSNPSAWQAPKLTVLVDAPSNSPNGERAGAASDWSNLQRSPGRGPTLWIGPPDHAAAESEFSAAIEAVWPRLGRPGENRVE